MKRRQDQGAERYKNLIDGDNDEILTSVKSGLDLLATALYLTETNVVTLYGLNLQLANLRFGLATTNRNTYAPF